jgi:hypothetical protein
VQPLEPELPEQASPLDTSPPLVSLLHESPEPSDELPPHPASVALATSMAAPAMSPAAEAAPLLLPGSVLPLPLEAPAPPEELPVPPGWGGGPPLLLLPPPQVSP